LIPIVTDALYLCSFVGDMFSAPQKSLTVITKLLLLECIPFFILYTVFCATLDDFTTGFISMPFSFFILFCPFVVVVQFASLVLLCMHLFSYINIRLSEILTEVSFSARDNLMRLTSLRRDFPSTKRHLRRRSSFQVMPSRRSPRHNHASGISTSRSQIFFVRPSETTPRINKDSTCLISSGFISHLRLQISSLIDFHDDLCDTIRSINSAYSVRILVNVADAFVCITVSLFCSYFYPAQRKHEETVYIFLLVICWSLVKLLVLLHVCTTCTEEVSKISYSFKKG
jgi:hypothetical protein